MKRLGDAGADDVHLLEVLDFEDDLIAVLVDADRPQSERATAAEILGNRRSSKAARALARALVEPSSAPWLQAAAQFALLQVPVDVGVVVADTEDGGVCPHDAHAWMAMDDAATSFCPDCDRVVERARDVVVRAVNESDDLFHAMLLDPEQSERLGEDLGTELHGQRPDDVIIADLAANVLGLRPGDGCVVFDHPSAGTHLFDDGDDNDALACGMPRARIVNAGDQRVVVISSAGRVVVDTTRDADNVRLGSTVVGDVGARLVRLRIPVGP
jgi:hypothetical protein